MGNTITRSDESRSQYNSRDRYNPHSLDPPVDPTTNKGLTGRNYLNVVAYLLNVIISCLSFSGGLTGTSYNEISSTNKTLLTPASWTFYSLLVVVFLMEGCFIVTQLIPKYGGLPIVQLIELWFVVGCLSQCGWLVLYTYEYISFSTMLAAALTAFFIVICIVQDEISEGPHNRYIEFWFIRFPFELHVSWAGNALISNVNEMVLVQGSSPKHQFVLAGFSYTLILLCGVQQLCRDFPSYTISLMLAWNMLGVAIELNNPSSNLIETFTIEKIERLRDTAYGIITSLVIINFTRFMYIRANRRDIT